MRYRIFGILAALMTVIGLWAPAVAFAGTSPPYHLMTNDNSSVGITYPGPGNQATITSNPGKTYFEADGEYAKVTAFVIHNHNGNCLRMRDKNHSYAVMEEKTCDLRDNNERFLQVTCPTCNQRYSYLNVATHAYLSVSCPAKNGNKVWGTTNLNGTCVNWLKKTP